MLLKMIVDSDHGFSEVIKYLKNQQGKLEYAIRCSESALHIVLRENENEL